MNIAGKTVLITGANRGIGRALVQEALRRGAKRVYAGTRGALDITDERVTPLTLDVTSAEQIEQAVSQVGSLDVLINNSGIAPYDDLSDPAVIEQALAVNFFGMYKVSRAFDFEGGGAEHDAIAESALGKRGRNGPRRLPGSN